MNPNMRPVICDYIKKQLILKSGSLAADPHLTAAPAANTWDCARKFKPFFITGSPKSGTTWITYILNAHPEVDIPAPWEGFLLEFFVKEFSKMTASYNELRKNPEHPFRIDDATGYKMLQRCLEILLTKAWSGNENVSLIGEKSPVYALHLDRIFHFFPGARVVNMVRDGRDVVVSLWFNVLNNLRRDHGVELTEAFSNAAIPNFFFIPAMKYWHAHAHPAKKCGETHQPNLMTVRYEDLNDDATLSRIFEFLDIDASPHVIAHCREKSSFERLSGGRDRGVEDTRSFFRKGVSKDYKNRLTPWQLAYARNKYGGLLSLCGYEA